MQKQLAAYVAARNEMQFLVNRCPGMQFEQQLALLDADIERLRRECADVRNHPPLQ